MKSLTEETLFRGMMRATEKRPSEMSKDQLSVAIELFTKEERYRFEERLGMLCGPKQPTMTEIEMAWDDVLGLRNETEL